MTFLSTPPSRVATSAPDIFFNASMFLSTPPSRVATGRSPVWAKQSSSFYPRHPRGWRLSRLNVSPFGKMFLSTPPSRVATQLQTWKRSWRRSFYPRHPRGWRRFASLQIIYQPHVSIHATLAGGDGVVLTTPALPEEFLSTPPSRVATGEYRERSNEHEVSIHATLAGGD